MKIAKKSIFFALAALIFTSVQLTGEVRGQEMPFKGTEITIGCIARRPADALRKLTPQFEKETGIKVHYEQLEGGALYDKLMIEFAGKTGAIDVFYLSPGWIGTMLKADYVLPIDKYIEKYKVDLTDFTEFSIEGYVKYPGRTETWGLPYIAEAFMLAYREDLFNDPKEKKAFRERYGYELRPPSTMWELTDVAEFFTRDTDGDGKIDFYGFANGCGSQMLNYCNMLWYLWSFGVEPYNEETYEVTINRPEAVKALKWSKKMLEFQPPEVFSWIDFYSHQAFFRQGKAAMIITVIAEATKHLDPKESELYDKTWFTPLPGKWLAGGGGLAISKYSRNPEAAFLFIDWATGKELAVPWFLEGGGITRKSAYLSEEIYKKDPKFAQLLRVHLKGIEVTAKSRLRIPEAWSIYDEFHLAWSEFAEGKLTAEQTVERMEKRIEEILTKAGYYKS